MAIVVPPLLFLVLLEGGSSLLLLTRNLARSVHPYQGGHEWARYDPLVRGAVALPNVYIEDMWGPGVYFQSNSQGFRNHQDFSPEVPEGRVRVLCSGDSYTMGQGVSNEDAWCEQLTALDPALETVNLGQSGYGFDNAYLRYRHFGHELNPSVHIFAFITADLYRMRGDWEWFWETPVLDVQDGTLVIPEDFRCLPCRHGWLLPVVVEFGRLRVTRLATRVARRLGMGQPVDRQRVIEEIADQVIADLEAMAAANGGHLVLLHLPTVFDRADESALEWRDWMRERVSGPDATYVDLVTDMYQVPADSAVTLFLPGRIDRGRHYSPAGNAWVAERVLDRLHRLPQAAPGSAGGTSGTTPAGRDEDR